MSTPISTLAVLATSGISGGDRSWVLGLLVGLGIYLLLRGGGNWVRWEYTGRDGQRHTTDWYDADTHTVCQDSHDPTHYTIRPRGES